MNTEHSAKLKYILAFCAVLFFRLLPFRAPNVEPLLAAVMPLGKRYGAFPGVLFAVLSMVVYDSVTSGLGLWTAITACAYGVLAVGSFYFFKNRTATAGNFVSFSVIGILFYDAVTGLTVGPLLYHESLASAFVGQIPFTVLHLIGGVLFAAVVSPALYRWLAPSESRAPARVPVDPQAA